MYSTLFIISALLLFFAQYYLGVQRNIDRRGLALTLLFSSFLLITFMKWPALLAGYGQQDVISTRYMMTGIVGVVLAIILCRHLLYVGYQRLDDIALVFPLSIAVIKVGCFITGCCFGLPTDSFLGVAASAGSPAFVHYHQGALTGGDPLLLHPVQLYESIGSLMLWFLVMGSRRRFTSPGSLFFFAMSGYLLIRFTTEFFRTTPAWDVVFWGLQLNQMVLLVLSVALLVLLAWNERKGFFKLLDKPSSPLVQWGLLFFVALGAMAFRSYLHLIEQLVIFIELVFTFFLLTKDSFLQQRTRIRLSRLAALFFCVLICTAQVAPDTVVNKYHSFKLGFGTGNYINDYYTESDGCTSLSNTYEQEYTVLGAGFSTISERTKSQVEVDYSAWVGKEKQTWVTGSGTPPSNPEQTFSSYGANVQAKIDYQWFGIGGGLSLGRLRMADDKNVLSNELSKGHFKTPILPSAYIRLGPYDIFYADYRYANLFPSPFPGFQHQISIGSGAGTLYDFNVRIGAVAREGTFVTLKIPIANFSVEPLYYWSGKDYSTGIKSSQFNISLSYYPDRDK